MVEKDTEYTISRGDNQDSQQQRDTTYFGESSRVVQSHLNNTEQSDLSSTPSRPPPPTLATSLSGIGLPYQIPRPSMVPSVFTTASSSIPAPTMAPYPSELNHGNCLAMVYRV